MTDFTSVLAKLARAEHHLDDFDTVLEAWIHSDPVGLTPTRHADGVTEDWWINITTEIPPVASLILGDCVHNFRSALDHLAMALAVDNGADILNTSTMFPIYQDQGEFQSNGQRRINLLSPVAQAFIERLQPYHRSGNEWLLWELNELDIADKHRTLLIHNLNQIWQMSPETGAMVEYPDPWLIEDGARFATVIYDPDKADTIWHPPLTLAITVDRSNRAGFLEVEPFLRDELLPHIRGVVAEAQNRFP